MSVSRRPSPANRPPRGVPRWFWPPPGASVTSVAIREQVDASGCTAYKVGRHEAPAPDHLRALRWLLDEHGRQDLPRAGRPFDGEVTLEIARTTMPSGCVGHAYALNGGPLGAPTADRARGILWRFIEATLSS